jgi:CheY-like chemotaxis protein
MASPDVIMVVDDNPRFLSTALEVLTDGAHAPVLARSSAAAMAALRGGLVPDAIVLNLDMKRPSGLVVLQEVEQATAEGIPVLALSARPGRLLVAAGADQVWVKPIGPAKLRSCLAALCAGGRIPPGTGWA